MSQDKKGLKLPVTVSLTSGKGGVGKTSLTVNLAVALSRGGKQVLIIDGDLGLANVDVLLRIQVDKNLRDVIENGEDPSNVVVAVGPGLGVLPASSGVPAMLSLGQREQSLLEKLLRKVSSRYDLVLVDTAAGIGPSVLWLNSFADHPVIVVTPDPTSMTDAYALIKVLARDYEREELHVVVNGLSSSMEGREVFGTLKSVAERFLQVRLHHLGSVPQDPEVARAVRRQVPFLETSPETPAARAVLELSEAVEKLPPRGSQVVVGKAPSLPPREPRGSAVE
jgi:flagellar biosynthesis protein FlhG